MLILDDQKFYEIYTGYSKNPKAYEVSDLLFDLITAHTSFKDSFLYNNEYNILICHLIESLPAPQAATIIVQAFVNVQQQNRKFNMQQFYWFKVSTRDGENYTVLRHFCPSALDVMYEEALEFFRAQIFDYEDSFYYSKTSL